MKLRSFSENANAVVIGASGGIGEALSERLSADASVHTLTRFRRSATGTAFIDIVDEASVEKAAEVAAATGPLDLVFVATGILHRDQGIQPEKAMRDLNRVAMSEVFLINAIAPSIVAKHFLPRMRKGFKTMFAALSARVGSISDNRLGGWGSYRASKAALNMLMKTLAIEHARRFPESIIAALHPGSVDTRLSRPFNGRVARESLFTPLEAADNLLTVIDRLDADDSGGFFAWDGKRIDF